MDRPTGTAPTAPRRHIKLHDPRPAPPLALPSLPRLTQRLILARPITRTENLRLASLDPAYQR